MMDLSQSNTTRPRPMTGRVCVAPIPASKEGGAGLRDPHSAVIGKLLFGFDLATLETGFLAGIVQEIGEIPTEYERHEDFLVPFVVGSTVYYSERSAIKLKGWHIITIASIVAWEAVDAA